MKTFLITVEIKGERYEHTIRAVDAADAADQLGNEIEYDRVVSVEMIGE